MDIMKFGNLSCHFFRSNCLTGPPIYVFTVIIQNSLYFLLSNFDFTVTKFYTLSLNNYLPRADLRNLLWNKMGLLSIYPSNVEEQKRL